MSHFPGNQRSGILAAYNVAPIRYNAPIIKMLCNEPFSKDSEMPFSIRKWMIGRAEIMPKETKTLVL